MGKVKDKLKSLTEKIDKVALAKAVGLMLISWAALPIIYWLIVRKKKAMEEIKNEEKSETLEEEKEK
jgi:hydrogenase maturation factor